MPRITNISNKPPLGTLISVTLLEMQKTQKWLSNDIGTDHVYLNRIITGRATPSLRMLGRIAKSLDINAKELVDTLLIED